MKMVVFEMPQIVAFSLKKEAYCLLISKWYPQACDVRTLSQEILELVNSNYDSNISLMISVIRRLDNYTHVSNKQNIIHSK